MNTSIKKLTMGAAVTAIFVAVFAIFTVNDEIVQEITTLITILPLSIYTRKYGMKYGIITMLASILLSIFMVQPVILLTYAIPAAIIGTVLGIIIDRLPIMGTISIVSGLNIIHLVYELIITKLFTKISIISEYETMISGFVKRVSGSDLSTVFAKLVHDMAICSIPIIFILGACARALISCMMLIMLMNRLEHADEIKLYLPKISLKPKPCAYIILAYTLGSIVLCALVLCEIISYSFVIAILLDAGFLLMYLYIVYRFRELNNSFKVNTPRNFLITIAMIVFFPITACVFAVMCIRGKNK